MIIVTSEYIFINPKLNEIKDITTNIRLEHDRKHGDSCCDKIDVKCEFKFFDKKKPKDKSYDYALSSTWNKYNDDSLSRNI